jgi:hypothetical protein
MAKLRLPPKPLDSYPCVWIVVTVPPRRSGIKPEVLSYGFPGQPFPDELLSRGAGMAFSSKAQAQAHLRQSLGRCAGTPFSKWGFRIIPIFLAYKGVKVPKRADS